MKKICIVVGKELPVPAVMGGAIEELVTMLIEENEIEQRAELIVFSKKNEQAVEQAKNYRHTQMVYLEKDGILDKVVNRIYRLMSKFTKPGQYIDLGYYRQVLKKMRKMEFDAIVCEGGELYEFRNFAKKYGKDKLYLHIHHHMTADKDIDGIFGNIISVSQFVNKEWLKTSQDKTIKSHVVYNCVNENKFLKKISEEQRADLRKKLGLKEDDFVVLYCGRIQEVKGVRELFEAFRAIEDSKCKLLVIGNADFAVNTITPFMEQIQKLVEEQKESIVFTGYIENKELYQYYQCADMQVVPSMWEEAAGLVAIEGMLSGLPLVVTRSGGLIEYAPENVAMQIDRKEIVKNLTETICYLQNHPDVREQMRAASFEHAGSFRRKNFYNGYIDAIGRELDE